MRCLCRPGWACSFLFLLFLAFPANLSPSENGIGFLAPGVCRCPRIRSQLGHTPPTGPVWGFAGVALPLLGLQNRTQGRTGASLGFLPQNKLTPPPKGGGAGYRVSWVCWGFLGLLGLPCSFTTGSHASNRACSGLRWCHSLPGFQNRTQGRTGAGLVSACWLAILRKIAFRNPV